MIMHIKRFVCAALSRTNSENTFEELPRECIVYKLYKVNICTIILILLIYEMNNVVQTYF